MSKQHSSLTSVLKQNYWNAGVREYWIAVVRADEIYFRILIRGDSGWQEQGGNQRSKIFKASSELPRIEAGTGHQDFALEVG
ncbi:MAG: hypothetical protein QF473_21450 [Planctomycetota bacterium]|jgi:hypothetical protein|nr:hypothetical protein [Planctomycetota bacterium]MDP6506737.1 hypothetical protein [Planctomycetota bacterium]